MTWDRIIVGTDGTERANRAVEHAGALAAAVDAELLVVTAYRESTRSNQVGALPAELEWTATAAGGAQEAANRGAHLARRQGAKRVRALGLAGEPLEVLTAAARDHGAGLIVVGSKGMTSAARFVVGSVPNEVSHHAPCDVLVVQTDGPGQ